MSKVRNGVLISKDIPQDLHPLAIQGDSDIANKCRVALDNLYSTLGHINKLEGDLRLDQNPMMGAEVARVAFPLVERVGVNIISTLDSLQVAKQTAEAAVNATLSPKDKALASEIRGYLRTKTKGLLSELILAARDPSNADLITAALSAPPQLSGLDATQQAELRSIAAMTYAPGPMGIIEETDKAIAKLNRANEFVTDYARTKKATWLPGSEVAKRLSDIMADKGEANAL